MFSKTAVGCKFDPKIGVTIGDLDFVCVNEKVVFLDSRFSTLLLEDNFYILCIKVHQPVVTQLGKSCQCVL